MYTPTLSSLNAYIQSWPLRAGVGWHRSCSLLFRWHLGFILPLSLRETRREAGLQVSDFLSRAQEPRANVKQSCLLPTITITHCSAPRNQAGWARSQLNSYSSLDFYFYVLTFQPNRSVVRSNELKSVQSANLFGRKRDTWTTLLFAMAVSTQHFSCKTSANLLVVEHNSWTGNEWRWDDEKGVLFCFDGDTYWVEVDWELGVIEHDCGNWKHLQIPFGVDKTQKDPEMS